MDKESQSKPRRYTGLVIALAVIAVFWILLTLPIIFYHLPQVSKLNAWILVGLRVNADNQLWGECERDNLPLRAGD